MEAFPSDTWYQEVREEIESGCTLEGRFSCYSLDFYGMLQKYMRCIYVPMSGGLHTLILSEAHRAPYFANPYVKNMYDELR